MTPPPPIYRHWWSLVEACSGSRASFDAVRWFRAPPASLAWSRYVQVSAYWQSVGNYIVIADDEVSKTRLVRHEMLHAIIGRSDHPRVLFQSACAGVVDCDGACRSDDRSLPEASQPHPPVVSVDSLRVSISSFPARPAASRYGGAFTITVTVVNPTARRILVRVQEAAHFVVDMGTSDRPMRGGMSDATFEPGEAKQFVFDLRVNSSPMGGGYAPGIYHVRGGFDVLRTAPLLLTITQ